MSSGRALRRNRRTTSLEPVAALNLLHVTVNSLSFGAGITTADITISANDVALTGEDIAGTILMWGEDASTPGTWVVEFCDGASFVANISAGSNWLLTFPREFNLSAPRLLLFRVDTPAFRAGSPGGCPINAAQIPGVAGQVAIAGILNI